MPDYNAAMAHIRLALMHAAPDEATKRRIKGALEDMTARTESNHVLAESVQARRMAAMLYDGLAYGNWPSAP